MIRGPREIYVRNGAGTVASIEIVSVDGVTQIVSFKDELLQPPQGK
jgi:hypothetical protein